MHEELVDLPVGSLVSVRDLLGIAMEKNGDVLSDIQYVSIGDSDLDTLVYVMDKDDPMIPFTVWTNWHVYFPLVNDMGIKWVASVPRNPSPIQTLIETH